MECIARIAWVESALSPSRNVYSPDFVMIITPSETLALCSAPRYHRLGGWAPSMSAVSPFSHLRGCTLSGGRQFIALPVQASAQAHHSDLGKVVFVSFLPFLTRQEPWSFSRVIGTLR
jgi:hypothetical protein